jgi:hypothetical protein
VQQLPWILKEGFMKAGLERANEASSFIRGLLGNEGWALYGMGSLGYGNYVPGWSDLDLDIVLVDAAADEPNDIAERANLSLLDNGYSDVDVKCFRLSDLCQPGLQLLYGLANRRVMLLDSAVHLYGPDIRSMIPRPEEGELRQECRRVADNLTNMPDEWWASRPLDDLAAILALPARLLYTAATGQVVSKTEALESLLASRQVDHRFWPWLSWALACRFSAAVRLLPAEAANDAQATGRELLRWTASQLGAA